MTTNAISPESAERNDDLLFAAALEALPPAVVGLAMLVAVLASLDDGLRMATHSLGVWLNPQAALAQSGPRLMLSVAMIVAYFGPGLGRLYLGDWDGWFKYLYMRGGLLAAAFAGYVVFLLMFFGDTDLTIAIVMLYATAALALAPIGVGFVSAWDLVKRSRSTPSE